MSETKIPVSSANESETASLPPRGRIVIAGATGDVARSLRFDATKTRRMHRSKNHGGPQTDSDNDSDSDSEDNRGILRKLPNMHEDGSSRRPRSPSLLLRSFSLTRSGSSVSVPTLLVSFVLAVALLLRGTAEAYLGGVNTRNNSNNNNSNSNKMNPAAREPKPLATAPNVRYTFQETPRDRRYFTSTGILPPLSPAFVVTGSNENNDNSNNENENEKEKREENGDAAAETETNRNAAAAAAGGGGGGDAVVVVTYTNDPKTVDEWLCQNVPYDGCFLGFDIERLPECRSGNPDPTDRADFAHAAVVQLATPVACLVVQLVDVAAAAAARHGSKTLRQPQQQQQQQGGGAPATTTTTSSASNATDTGDHHHHHQQQQQHSCYHCHPNHSNDCAKILKSVLEDPTIVKAGCSIDEDLVLLHELWGIDKGNSGETHRAPRSPGSGPGKNGKYQQRQTKKAKAGVDNRSHKSKAAKHRRRGRPLTGSHGHRFSLRARSRFDLGCVVLPKPPTPSGEEDSDAHAGNSDHDDPVKGGFQTIVAKTTKGVIPNKSGLQGLSRAILGVELPKDKDDCASDWTRFPLTDDQITYAARDAWAGAAIATELAAMRVDTEFPAGCCNGSNNDPGSVRGRGNNNNKVFSRSGWTKILRQTETPLPQLARRHRQRKEAKNELGVLLHPYARNSFLRQHHEKQSQQREQEERDAAERTGDRSGDREAEGHAFLAERTNGTTATSSSNYNYYNSTNGTQHIDVRALFAGSTGSTTTTKEAAVSKRKRALANHAQQQHQLMEKSLPKRIRKRTIALRQIANARVIDHRVVFEIDLVRPPPNDGNNLGTHGPSRQQQQQQQQQWRHQRPRRIDREPPSATP